jgi:hypothetical protein
MNMRLKAIVSTLGVIFLIAVGLVSFAAWSCNSPAVDLGALNRLQAGMTKGQVQEILGEPDEEVSTSSTPGSQWWYKHPFKWYALRIDFTEDGTLLRYIHDD